MIDSDGNKTQTSVIASQLFDTWQAEQELRRRKQVLFGSVPAWFAAIVSAGTLIWGAAVLASDVSENRRRIEAMEGFSERLARIETKLDLIMVDKEQRDER